MSRYSLIICLKYPIFLRNYYANYARKSWGYCVVTFLSLQFLKCNNEFYLKALSTNNEFHTCQENGLCLKRTLNEPLD